MLLKREVRGHCQVLCSGAVHLFWTGSLNVELDNILATHQAPGTLLLPSAGPWDDWRLLPSPAGGELRSLCVARILVGLYIKNPGVRD